MPCPFPATCWCSAAPVTWRCTSSFRPSITCIVKAACTTTCASWRWRARTSTATPTSAWPSVTAAPRWHVPISTTPSGKVSPRASIISPSTPRSAANSPVWPITSARPRGGCGCITWPLRPTCSSPSPPTWKARALPVKTHASCWRNPSAIRWNRRARSTPPSARCSPNRASTGSTITWARRRCRTSWRCASPMRCSSRSGGPPTSTISRSPWPKPWAWRIAAAITTTPAPCATCCRTTCCNCSAWWRWRRRCASMPRRCATRRSRCSRR